MAERPGFFKDKDGNTVIYQHPNNTLLAFLLLTGIHMLTSGDLSEFLGMVAYGFGFAWAIRESKDGVNTFRRGLGVTVFIGLLIYALYRSY